MTAPDPPLGTGSNVELRQLSLIQQRMQLDRQRTLGVWGLSGGLLFGTLQVANLVLADPPLIWAWLALFGWVLATVGSAISLIIARRARQRFEAEHGKTAGRQTSVH